MGTGIMEGGPGATLSRRNSVRSSGGGSRRGSVNLDGDYDQTGIFGQMKPLKKSKPVSSVKITFMGKPMELMVPMNEDINIYDGRNIEGSSEAKSRSTWVEMFDMIDLAINNLQKVNKEQKPKTSESTPQVSVDVEKKFEVKVQKIEENICQWIDEETKTLKDTLEKDVASIRNEVDSKNIDMNSKVQGSIQELKHELNTKVAEIDEKLNNLDFNDNNQADIVTITNGDDNGDLGWVRAVLDLKNKLHKNCNTLRFLCSEPLSVQ